MIMKYTSLLKLQIYINMDFLLIFQSKHSAISWMQNIWDPSCFSFSQVRRFAQCVIIPLFPFSMVIFIWYINSNDFLFLKWLTNIRKCSILIYNVVLINMVHTCKRRFLFWIIIRGVNISWAQCIWEQLH
jgi:hypothetical protein